MTGWHVTIPGVVTGFSAQAENSADAITEALLAHGLTFAPPGTTAVEIDGVRR